jgi:hypothetical protein
MKALSAALLAILFVALLLWRPWETAPPDQAQPTPSTGAGSTAPSLTQTGATVPEADLAPPVAPPAEPKGLTPQEIQTVRDAIDNLEFVFRDFATGLGGNPVGTNAEITAALRGDNLKQLKLDLPQDSTINPAGELCDPWGTPWFFHQLSRTKMEIRSAGKDRQLYTEDDFVR